MKVATRFILKLRKEEEETLKHLWENSPSVQIRKRAHGILLSSEKYSIDDISNILACHRDSVSSWLDAWENKGIVGLFNKPRSGAPSLLDESDIEKIGKILNKYPHSPKTILAKFIESTGKTISLSTLRRVIRKKQFSWKRMRKSLKHKRNQEAFEKTKQEIQD